MKVKLLKKLRKRFLWYRDENHNCWYLFNKVTKRYSYAFVFNFYYVNDMCMYYMFREMGMLYMFKSLRDRNDGRVIKGISKK